MEFKKIIKVIKKDLYLFIITWLVFFTAGVFLIILEPEKFKIIIPAALSRERAEKTNEFQYDQYYKVMADEKFGKSLAAIFNSDNFLTEIKNRQFRDKEKSAEIISLKARDLAPGFIEIEIKTRDKKHIENITKEFKQLANEKIASFGAEGEDAWFVLDYQPFSVYSANLNKLAILSGSLIFGFFISLAIVVFRYYWKL